ncbi:hypothetical protein RSAG8_09242, partial [Rhizoctonia solani AG-8 WAC10335]
MNQHPNLPLMMACLALGINLNVPIMMGHPPARTAAEELFQGARDAMDKCFDRAEAEIEQKWQQMQARMSIHDSVMTAQSLNGCASGRADDTPLFIVLLPNGDRPGPMFPRTLGALKNIPEENLDLLILRYVIATGDDIPQGVDDKRKLVARHFGVRLDM